MSYLVALTKPKKLFSRHEVLSKTSLVPPKNGIYAWYFRTIPPSVITKNCIKVGDSTLLYAGISPKNNVSKQNLRNRITYHFRGNAEGSTLRLSLGILLEGESGYPLRRVGTGRRTTFTHLGEQWLDNWMENNAYVCWVENERPWEIEKEIMKKVSLPLNIQGNEDHPFSKILSQFRVNAKYNARKTPIANEDNQQR